MSSFKIKETQPMHHGVPKTLSLPPPPPLLLTLLLNNFHQQTNVIPIPQVNQQQRTLALKESCKITVKCNCNIFTHHELQNNYNFFIHIFTKKGNQ